MADGTSFAQWAAQVRALVELLDQDGPHDPNTELARNRLHLSGTLDGVTALSGQLGGNHTLTVRHAIEAVADDLFRRYTADHGVDPSLAVPARATLRALALAELCRRAGAVDVQASKPPRPEVTLVVHASAPQVAADEDGVWLADGTSRTLVCDADLFPLVIDSLGIPLDLGRRIRVAPRTLRRVLAARDGGCVFPGCDVPARWCDYHHLDAFAAGGDTTVTNLAGLCRHHHRITHRPGWSMHASPDGWYWWQTPTDRTFWSQRHHHQHPAPPPPPHPRH